MKPKPNILYIKPSESSFILSDQLILEKHYNVTSYKIKYKNNPLYFTWELLKLLFYLLFHASNADAIITWFADYHAMVIVFISKIFRIKSVIFVGGQEAICYPELRKGVYYKKFRGRCVKYALRHTDLIIPNHKSLVFHENFYYSKEGKKDGIKYYIPDLTTRIEVIPNGYDTNKYNRDYSIEKVPNMVLTIGKTNTVYDIENKGFDIFVQVAKRNPYLEFVIIAIKKEHIGWLEEHYKISELKNLNIIPYFCPLETMNIYYNKAKVFVQASITEGMPNTLGEAMLFECIPVGSNVNGIPDSIGDTGIIVYNRNVDELEKAIYDAFKINTGVKAKNYIFANFTLEKREQKLIEILNEIL